ncbi:methyltransferase B [Aspergillus campestris IBT 28561]|uniref:Methyltransferase B n=1 Tax=Aspergillus campestris (strain IBT 28561) TaxID=1392248 RepID=A0A2I1D7G2_ASPC2|nr:methyltransferase B [Aspergillus campestris IBT 28561]PKY05822.1 methyltransferase B [Aspergillus campestris IBT 28561]
MDAAIQQIKNIYTQADEDTRKSIKNELNNLQTFFRSDLDLVSLMADGPVRFGMAKVGIDLGTFKMLRDHGESLSTAQLAEKSGAAPELLERVLRAQATFNLIDQTGDDKFKANRLTGICADEHASALLSHQYDLFGPAFSALPSFLKSRAYKPVTSSKDTAFQQAHNTTLTSFEYLTQHPEHMEHFEKGMKMMYYDNWWFDVYPVRSETHHSSPSETLLIDLGGCQGQQAIAFRTKFSDVPGRVVVQDMPETLAGAGPAEGVELIAHDFFTPQPIERAKFYYMRRVLHDWPDEECVRILRNIVPVMAPDSRIIIDEMVLPERDVPEFAVYIDVTMFAANGGAERTTREWKALLDRAGLRVLSILPYDPKLMSVIEAVPK